MTTIRARSQTWGEARSHLRGDLEQVGFFIADYDADADEFVVRDWRAMPPEAFAIQSAFHVTLRDEVRPAVIRWAWEQRRSLIEIHSHGDHGSACFSLSDLSGFEEWVPHVRWRLGGLPYAAIVVADDALDALAWIGSEPAQVEAVVVDGEGARLHPATAQTLSPRPRLKRRRSS